MLRLEFRWELRCESYWRISVSRISVAVLVLNVLLMTLFAAFFALLCALVANVAYFAKLFETMSAIFRLSAVLSVSPDRPSEFPLGLVNALSAAMVVGT